jgi:uncharacterized protein
LLATFAICLLHPPVHADIALYEAMVPLQGATEADRTAGFGAALRVAVVRASGRREAAAEPRVAAAAADPARYVQQYSTTADRMLKVGFDSRALEQLLQQANLPLWPAERPATTVYLFLPGIAGGARAVGAGERPPERVALERAAQGRGVPLAWPAEQIDAATARERSASTAASHAILVGMAGPGRFEWTFGHAGQTARGQGGLTDGVDLAADTLADRYAPTSTRGATSVKVRVGGIDNVRSYAALTGYLQELSLVRGLEVDELAGDTVQLRLELRGDVELLRRIVALDSTHLQAVPSGGTAPGDAPDFIWQP